MSAILKIKFNYEDDVQLTWNLAEIFSVTQILYYDQILKIDIILINHLYQNDRMSAILRIKFNYEDDVQLPWYFTEIFSVTQSFMLRWDFEVWYHFH